MVKLAIFMKVLVFCRTWVYAIFSKTTPNLSYDQKCCPFSDHTNVTHDFQLLTLVQRLSWIECNGEDLTPRQFFMQIIFNVKISRSTGILPRYNTMKCQLHAINVMYLTRYMSATVHN